MTSGFRDDEMKTYWSELDDEQLMRILASGHAEPLGELYIRHSAMVKDAMMRFCPEISVAEAEEMVQDVFLILNRKAAKYQEQMKFKAWLYGIAVRTVSSWRRTYWLRRKLLERHENKHVGLAVQNTRNPARDMEGPDAVDPAAGTDRQRPPADVDFRVK